MFNPHSNKIKQSIYQLLIMDNHKNYEILEFNIAYKKLNIILIYILPHFFHLLQPLDINFFYFSKKHTLKNSKIYFNSESITLIN